MAFRCRLIETRFVKHVSCIYTISFLTLQLSLPSATHQNSEPILLGSTFDASNNTQHLFDQSSEFTISIVCKGISHTVSSSYKRHATLNWLSRSPKRNKKCSLLGGSRSLGTIEKRAGNERGHLFSPVSRSSLARVFRRSSPLTESKDQAIKNDDDDDDDDDERFWARKRCVTITIRPNKIVRMHKHFSLHYVKRKRSR